VVSQTELFDELVETVRWACRNGSLSLSKWSISVLLQSISEKLNSCSGRL